MNCYSITMDKIRHHHPEGTNGTERKGRERERDGRMYGCDLAGQGFFLGLSQQAKLHKLKASSSCTAGHHHLPQCLNV